MKSLDTLVADIERLFTEGHDVSPENAERLGKAIADTITRRLREPKEPPRPFKLSLSQIGKRDKQMWFESRANPADREKLSAAARTKFLFGDILEHLLIFLVREAGHTVTDEQAVVEINGIQGHMDCKIDGEVVDTKSASSRSFTKFQTGALRRDDPFGYMWQLTSYAQGSHTPKAAFLAIDKTLGHICLMRVPKEEIELYDVPGRIDELKAMLAKDEPPEYCCDSVPEGKSGNMRLAAPCTYNPYKHLCHPGLRVFLYSTGPKFLTKVVREPRAAEIIDGRIIDIIETEENGEATNGPE